MGKPKLDLPGRLLLLAVLLWFTPMALMLACSGNAKRDARTANDIADMACTLFATQEAEKAQAAGINVGDIADAARSACEAKEKSQPFLDALLAVQRETAVERAAAMGISGGD